MLSTRVHHALTKLALVSSLACIIPLLPATALADWFNCEPTEVIEWSTRIHVRCSNAHAIGSSSIRWVAIDKTDVDKAARFISLANAALLSDRIFLVQVSASSGSNVSGCLATDCRTPSAFGVKNP